MNDVAETIDLLGLEHSTQTIKGENIVADTRLIVSDGIIWFIYGYNCTQTPQNCSELQFRAVIEYKANEQQPLLDLNLWNAKNRFVRAYTTPGAKTVILEMDVYLAGGVTLSNVTDQILLWRQSLRKFLQSMEAR